MTQTRRLLLKRPERRNEKQSGRLADLLQFNLKIVRAYLLMEDFQFFRNDHSPDDAGSFLDRWCSDTLHSQIVPMKRVARMPRRHRDRLLN